MKRLAMISLSLLAGAASIFGAKKAPVVTNVEPPCWWAGMSDPSLQVMVTGPGIAAADVTADYPGVTLKEAISLDSPEDRELLEAVAYLYRSIGYRVIEVSSITGEGLDKVRDALRDHTTLVSGNSGVGKSTLINALIPGLDLKTAAISDVHDQGIHTTTFSEMFPLPFGGWIIDTPGVRGFGTIEMAANEVSHYFPEIFKESAGCRFGDCTHTHEPGCAVLRAIGENRIAQSRYNSYLSILNDSEEGKYRAPQ